MNWLIAAYQWDPNTKSYKLTAKVASVCLFLICIRNISCQSNIKGLWKCLRMHWSKQKTAQQDSLFRLNPCTASPATCAAFVCFFNILTSDYIYAFCPHWLIFLPFISLPQSCVILYSGQAVDSFIPFCACFGDKCVNPFPFHNSWDMSSWPLCEIIPSCVTLENSSVSIVTFIAFLAHHSCSFLESTDNLLLKAFICWGVSRAGSPNQWGDMINTHFLF